MDPHNNHISPYKDHIMVLLGLIALTVITVAITSIELGALNTAAALVIASIKAGIVLMYFMHLRFDQRIYRIMTFLVIALVILVIAATVFDYLTR